MLYKHTHNHSAIDLNVNILVLAWSVVHSTLLQPNHTLRIKVRIKPKAYETLKQMYLDKCTKISSTDDLNGRLSGRRRDMQKSLV